MSAGEPALHQPRWVESLLGLGIEVTNADPAMLPDAPSWALVWAPQLTAGAEYLERVRMFVQRHIVGADHGSAAVITDGSQRFLVATSLFDSDGDFNRHGARVIARTFATPIPESEDLP